MLTFLPVFLLMLTAVGVFVFQRGKSGFGVTWLVAAAISFVVWALILVYHWLVPTPYTIENWLPFVSIKNPLEFSWDAQAWPLGFSMAAVLLAVIWSSPARFKVKSNPSAWAANFILTGVTLLAVISATPLALLLAWTFIDLFELAAMVIAGNERRLMTNAVIVFSTRLMGTLVMMAAVAYSRAGLQAMTFDGITPQAGLLVLLAVGLRLGVFPLHMPFRESAPLQRGVGYVLRIAVPASALILLPQISGQVFSDNSRGVFYALLSLAAVYGASRWLNAEDEITGRPFWLIALSAMALASSILGNKDSVIVWAVTIIISTAGLFLFSHRSTLLRVILLINLIALTGLPFTPLVIGMGGLIGTQFTFFTIFFFITHALLLLGFLKHLARSGDSFNELEPWMQTTYVGALVAITLTYWAATAFSTSWLLLPKNWWAGIPGTVITVGVVIATLLQRRGILKFSGRSNWALAVFQRIGKILNQAFSLEWVYRLLWVIYELVSKLIRAITIILEGDGGVLWAAVLLALLISLLWSAKG